MTSLIELLNTYTPVEYLTQPNHRTYWLYLLVSVFIAWVMQCTRAWSKYFHAQRDTSHPKPHPIRYLTHSIKPLLNQQARLDYTYFLINWCIKVLCIMPLLISANTVAQWCVDHTHTTLFTASQWLSVNTWSYESIAIVYTLVLFIINDASRYALHRAMHAIEWLWAFHKVHHSATELNPFTFYRVHPVENMLFGLRYALVTGSITGVFIGLFGAKLSLMDIAGVNALVYVLNIIGANLRHSSVFLRYPKWLECVFISPAQHQLHHQYKTSRKNYGSFLAIWDAWFGSLLISNKTNKPKKFGLNKLDNTQYNSVWGLLFSPFKQLRKNKRKHPKQFNKVKKRILNYSTKAVISLIAFVGLFSAYQAKATALTPEQELGQMLYFDTHLSKNKTQSCASCHNPSEGFVDTRPNPSSVSAKSNPAVSMGDDGKSLGSRNAPTASYASHSPEFYYDKKNKQYIGGQFWDGRAKDLAEQSGGPPLNPLEMNMPSKMAIIQRIKESPVYIKQFEKVYGQGSLNHTEKAYTLMQKAISAFEHSEFFSPFDSKYDKFLRGEYDLSPLEDLGRTLFFSNNNVSCGSCHLLKKEDAIKETFSNYQYHNIGVPKNPRLATLVPSLSDDIDHGLLSNPHVTDRAQDGKFKVPTLRNIAITGPYMHNGVFQDLETVVLFYDKFNNPERTINPETGKPWAEAEVPETVNLKLLKGKKLTQRKVDALVAFMKILTDARYEHLIKEKTTTTQE